MPRLSSGFIVSTCLIAVFISSMSFSFTDGPEFSHNTNGSQWIEIKTNNSYNITCTVVDSNPPVEHMNFTYKGTSDNIRVITNNDTSITLEITNARPNNTMDYTCEASTNFTKSHVVYQTFIGGMPCMITNINQTVGQFAVTISTDFLPG